MLIATDLKTNTEYTILLEFSEEYEALDGEAGSRCDHFRMAIKMWDTKNVCAEDGGWPEAGARLSTTPGEDYSITTIPLSEKIVKKELVISGKTNTDVQIIVDNSDAFFKTDLSLKNQSADNEVYDETAAIEDAHHVIDPVSVDPSRKHATVYWFSNIAPGTYAVKLR